jgi:hypothetical protein
MGYILVETGIVNLAIIAGFAESHVILYFSGDRRAILTDGSADSFERLLF